jgi:hypothetical protein
VRIIGNTIDTRVDRHPLYATGVSGLLHVEGNIFQANGFRDCAWLDARCNFDDVIWKSNQHFNGNSSGLRFTAGRASGGHNFGSLQATGNHFQNTQANRTMNTGIHYEPRASCFRSEPRFSNNVCEAGIAPLSTAS